MRKVINGRTLLLVALLAASVVAGCQLLAIPFAEREATREIPAEFDLTAERLLVFPYVSYDISYEFNNLPLHLMQQVILRLDNTKVGRVIDPREVLAFQQNNLDWQSMPVERIGQHFKVDKVLYLEVEAFGIREWQSANLYRGRAEVAMQVVTVPTADRPAMVPYEGTVNLTLPEDRPIGTSEISEDGMYQATLIRLSESIANKFRDHKVKVLGGGSR